MTHHLTGSFHQQLVAKIGIKLLTYPFAPGFSTFPQSPCKRTPRHPLVARFRGILRQSSPMHSTRPHRVFLEVQLARPQARLDPPDRRLWSLAMPLPAFAGRDGGDETLS